MASKILFPVDVLGNPMREFEPERWESAVWPSDVDANRRLKRTSASNPEKVPERLAGLNDTQAVTKIRLAMQEPMSFDQVYLYAQDLVNRIQPLISLAENIDPAKVPELTLETRCQLGGYAKPVTGDESRSQLDDDAMLLGLILIGIAALANAQADRYTEIEKLVTQRRSHMSEQQSSDFVARYSQVIMLLDGLKRDAYIHSPLNVR